jgi:hypothetical protein
VIVLKGEMADTAVPFKNENLYVEHELNGEKKVSYSSEAVEEKEWC